jgi:DNA-directed RNA polymerase specialized sigma subunit
MAQAPSKKKPRGYLATPLDRDEQRRVARLYREHGGLVNHMGRKMCRKYPALLKEDIYSCIDIAFIKTCRAWNPVKGTFSTLLGVFCEGEIRHFIRDHNWSIKAPSSVRSIGMRAQYMLRAGHSTPEVCATLNITGDSLKLALSAVQSLDHEIQDFRLHVCPRPTPWDVLEASEEN